MRHIIRSSTGHFLMTRLHTLLLASHLVVVFLLLTQVLVGSSRPHEKVALSRRLPIRKESNTSPSSLSSRSLGVPPRSRRTVPIPFHYFTKKTQENRNDISQPQPVHFPLSLTLMSMLPRKGADLIPMLLHRGKDLLKSKRFWTTTGVASCLMSYHLLSYPRAARATSVDIDENNHYNPHAKKMNFRQVVTRAGRFWWNVGPIIAHYKFTQSWVEMRRTKSRYSSGLSRQRVDEIYDELHDKYATAGLDVILEMRGLFIKIGQVLSSRPDFIPKQFIDCFGSLQDSVPPWNSKEIKQLVADSLKRHHGLDEFEDVFCDFEDEPVGSASIGQVHRATLAADFYKTLNKKSKGGYKGGRKVAIKVMHLDAQDRFKNDLQIFRWLCKVALPGWTPIIKEFESQILTEFNYMNEAENLRSVRENMLASPYRKKVVIPSPLIEYSTPNVLIMEYLDGVKLAQAAEDELAVILNGDKTLAKLLFDEKRTALFSGALPKSPVEEMKRLWPKIRHFPVHQRALAVINLALFQRRQCKAVELLLDAHGHQILVNGKFNGDCHPGNVLSLSSGRLGLIDYGQCKILCDDDRMALSRIIYLLGSSDVDEDKVASAMKDFGFTFENDRVDIITQTANLFFDSDSKRRDVGCYSTQDYLMYLQARNSFLDVPDPAVFVARASFLFRGMGSLLGMDVRTSQYWAKHAKL